MSRTITFSPFFFIEKKGIFLYKKIKYTVKFAVFLFFFFVICGSAELWGADNKIAFSDDIANAAGTLQSYISSDEKEKNKEIPGLPEIYKISINMIYPGEVDGKAKLAVFIKKLLDEDRYKDAARKLGEILGRERKSSKAYLGFYCKNALPTIDGGMKERASFLRWFLNGYGKSGIVMFPLEGIEKFSASGRQRGDFWKFVGDGKVPSEKLERIYKSDNVIYIPFSLKEVFLLDIVCSDHGNVSVWKILPGGINHKTWASGNWEREIKVRGDKIN